MEPNPMQNVLRRQMGIDAFGMDRDEEVLWESVLDRPRNPTVSLRTPQAETGPAATQK